MSQLIRRTARRASRSKLFLGHHGFVEDLLVLPSGVMISVDSHGEIIVWNLEEDSILEQFGVSSSSINGVAQLPGTEDVAVWDWGGTLLRLSIPDLTGIVRLDLHEDRILDTAFAYIGGRRLAATASMDNTAVLADIDAGEILFRTDPHDFWVVKVFLTDQAMVTISRDGGVRRFTHAGEPIATHRLLGKHFVTGAFSDDLVAAATYSGEIFFVDITSGEERLVEGLLAEEPALVGFDQGVLILGDSDGRLHWIDASKGERVLSVEAHDGGIMGGALFESRVVSFGLDRTVGVFERATGEELRRIDDHDNLVGCAGIFRRQYLFTGSADTTIRKHNLEEEDTPTVERHRSLVTGLRFIDGELVSWAYNDDVARRWDPETGRVHDRWAVHAGDVNDVRRLHTGEWASASDDGTFVIGSTFGDPEPRVVGIPRGIRCAGVVGPHRLLVATMTGEIILLDDVDEVWRRKHKGDILRLEIGNSVGRFATSTSESTHLWSLEGERIAELDAGPSCYCGDEFWLSRGSEIIRYGADGVELARDDYDLRAIARLMSCDAMVVGVDVAGTVVGFEADGSVRWTVRGPSSEPSAIAVGRRTVLIGWHNAGARAYAVADGAEVFSDPGSSDELIVDVALDDIRGEVVVVGWDEARFYYLDKPDEEPIRLTGLPNRPDSAWFVANGVWIGTFGGQVWEWSPEEGTTTEETRHFSILAGVDYLDDGRRVTWSWDGRVVWEDGQGVRTGEFGGHGSFVYGVDRLAGGDLVSWSYDGTARQWDGETLENVALLPARARGFQSGCIVGDTAWLGSSNGDLFSWRPYDQDVTLFSRDDWHSGVLGAMATDGESVVTGSRDGKLGVWDGVENTNLAFWLLTEYGEVASVAISSDGAWVAAGTSRGQIIICDISTLGVHVDFTGHGAVVRDLAFAPDADVLYSVSKDLTLAAWNLEGELLSREGLDAEGYSVAVDTGGVVATGDGSGRVAIWEFAEKVH